MRIGLLTLLCAVLIGCGTQSSDDDSGAAVEPKTLTVAQAVASFEAAGRPHLGASYKVTTAITLLAKTVMCGDVVAFGCAYTATPTTPAHIDIDGAAWQTAGDATREIVVWHELGHIELKRDHPSNCAPVVLDGVSLAPSIMCNPTMTPTGVVSARPTFQQWTAHRNYYINELFTNRNQ